MQKGKQGGLTISQIHFLHHQTDEILDDLQNRVGASAFWADEHIEDLKDNEETFDFTMRADIPASAHATKKNRVVIPDRDGNLREFIIYEVIQDNHMEKEVYTIASYTELEKQRKPIPPQVLDAQTVNMAVDWTLAGTEWQRGITEYAGIRKVTIDKYTDPLKLLKQLAILFGMELRFRVVRDRNRIIGRYVDMVKKRGEDTKKETVLGNDLIGIQRREATDIVTALLVVGPESEDGERLTVEVVDEGAFQRWGRNGNHLWALYEPETENEDITLSRLTQLGRTQLDKMINTVVQYSATSVGLEENFNLSHERVRIGDVNRVKDTSFVPPLYMEARIIKVTRSISDPSKQSYVLGDFIEYREEDILKTFRQLQVLYGAKVIRSNTPPANRKQGMIWVDTSGERDVIYTWNAASQKWDKATPTFAEEVGAYDKETVDNKDQHVYDDSTRYTDIVTEEAKEEAVQRSGQYTREQVLAKEQEIIATLNDRIGDVNQVIADLSLEAASLQDSIQSVANDMTAMQTTINEDILGLQNNASSLLQKVQNNEAALLAANGKLVSVEQEVDTINGRMSTTITELANLDGIVSEQQLSINHQAGQISEKASITTVNTLTGRVTTTESNYLFLAGEMSFKANTSDVYTKSQMNTELGKKVDTTVYTSKVAQLDVSFNGIQGTVSSIQNQVTSVDSRLVSAQSQIDIQAGFISAKAEKNEVYTRMETDGKITTAVNSAKAEIKVTTDGISQSVTSLSGLVQGTGRWINNYRVNTATPLQLTESDGRPWNDDYTYQVTAKVTSTGTNTTAIAIFRSNKSGTSGAGWTLELLYQIGTSSNHPQFYLDEDGKPSIKLYGHTVFYTVEVTHEKVRGRVNANSVINQFATSINQKADSIILNVNSLTQTVDTQGNRISSAETTINQQTTSINLKANATDVYTKSQVDASVNGRVANTTYNNKMSSLDLSITSITNRVQNTETNINSLTGEVSSALSQIASLDIKANWIIASVSEVRADLTNLEVGGTNIYFGSLSDINNFWGSGTLSREYVNDVWHVRIDYNGTASNFGILNATSQRKMQLTAGKKYTLSFEVRGNIGSMNYLYSMRLDGNNQQLHATNRNVSSSWNKIFVTFTSDHSTSQGYILLGSTDVGSGKWFEIRKVQVEEGVKATTWGPNSLELEGRVAIAESTLSLLPGQINAKASQTEVNSLTGRMNTAEATLNVLPGQINAKVEKNGVVAAINLSTETTRILSSKIHIDGNVTFSNGFDPRTALDIWKFGNTTEIDGAKIRTGTITAREVIIGSPENLVADPHFLTTYHPRGSSNGGSSSGWDVASTTLTKVGSQILRYRPNGQMTTNAQCVLSAGLSYTNQEGHIVAQEGETYLAEIWVRRASSGSVTPITRICFSYRDATGSQISTSISNAYTPTTAYQKISVRGTCPPNTAYIIPYVRVDSNSSADYWIYFDSAFVKRMLDGNLVVDGTITANHIHSLNGLNVGNGQFVIDSTGNVTLRGRLEGVTGTFSGSVSTTGAGGSIVLAGDRLTSSDSSWTSEVYSGRVMSRLGTENNLSTLLNPNGIFHKRDNRMIFALTDRLVSGRYSADLWAEQVDSLDLKVGISAGNPIANFKFTFDSDGHNILHIGNSIIKGLAGSTTTLQVRNAIDTAYSDMRLSHLFYSGMTQSSRREFKKNISDVYLDALSLINELTFQEFHYKEQKDEERRHLGLIMDDTDTYFHDPIGHGIDTVRLLHVNSKAIQELYKRDENIYAEIERLKEKIAHLQQQIAC